MSGTGREETAAASAFLLALSVIPAYLFVAKRSTRTGGAVSALPAALLAGFFAGLVPKKMHEVLGSSEEPRSKIILACFSAVLGITVLFGPVTYSYQTVSASASERFLA